jgi:hypothetical protein
VSYYFTGEGRDKQVIGCEQTEEVGSELPSIKVILFTIPALKVRCGVELKFFFSSPFDENTVFFSSFHPTSLHPTSTFSLIPFSSKF